MKKITNLTCLLIIFLICISTNMLVGCSKTIVDFDIRNSDIASFVFDKAKYELGDTANFSVNLKDKYSKSDFTVYANNVLLVANNNCYSYKLNDDSVIFEIKDYSINSYTYTFSANEGFEFYTLQNEDITYGENFSFFVNTDKYENDFVVKVNNNIISPTSSGEYIVNNVCEDLIITITDYTIKSFDVSYDICTGIEIVFDGEVIHNVYYGENINFDISLTEGYVKDNNFKVLVNDTELIYDNGYHILNINNNIDIKIEGVSKECFNVSFENTEGLNIVGNNIIYYGDTYNFSFSLLDYYILGSNFDILCNDISILKRDAFEYEIFDVTSNIEIKFIGVEKVKHDVSFIFPAGINVDGEANVVHGENYTFTFELLENYKLLDNFGIFVGDINIYEENKFTYIINNIIKNLQITFVNVDLVEYDITYSTNIDNSCNVILNSTSIAHGANYNFTIEAIDGYDISNIIVKVNDVLVDSIDGIYYVYNVTSEQVISITGVELINKEPEYYIIKSIPKGLALEFEINDEYFVDIASIKLHSDDIITIFFAEDPSDKFIVTDSFELITNTGVIECEEEFVMYILTGISEDVVITTKGMFEKGEHAVIVPESSDYSVNLRDTKYIYCSGEYFTFELLINDNNKTAEVEIEGNVIYGSNGIYTFQIKDEYPNEIFVNIRIN